MFRYAAKRIIRGKSNFFALFLSIALATTLFSGILQGADSSGLAMLSKVLKVSDVDIVSGALNRNLTKTSFREVHDAIKKLDGVAAVEHVVRLNMTSLVLNGANTTLPITVVSISNDSNLFEGINGVDYLEKGKIYIERGSRNASLFSPGENKTFRISTYNPFGNIFDFGYDYYNLTIGSTVDLDERVFSIATGSYPLFIRSIIIGSEASEKRPPYQLAVISEETLWEVLNSIYAKKRSPAFNLEVEIIVKLDRGRIVTPWDISGSGKKIDLIYEKINTIGASYGYVPVNYLSYLLSLIETYSSETKFTTLLVAAPIFFIAWYLGGIVSELSYGQRRREIGLLNIRGISRKQLFYIFVFEAALIGIFSGVAALLLQALIISLVMPELGFFFILSSISPYTIIASFLFSIVLSLLAVYKPARDAAKMEIIEALKEYGSEEERISWQEPALALALGAYKILMYSFGIRVESFAPSAENILIYLLYSTWFGVDYILSYIAPILFFWGFVKLFLYFFSPLRYLHNVFGRLVGESSVLSTLSAQRNVKRVAASTFLVAMIFGYSVQVVGNMDGTRDYMERTLRLTIGSDACAWLFSPEGAVELSNKIAALEGVEGATVEMWFDVQSNFGTVEARIIDPLNWSRIAYIDPAWVEGENVFEKMDKEDKLIMLERGAAEQLGLRINDAMLIKMDSRVYSLNITGIFGRVPSQNWVPQEPTIYIGKNFIENLEKEDIKTARILVKFKEGVDEEKLIKLLEELDPNISSVDAFNQSFKKINSNILFSTPGRIQQLGIYFAVILSSIGVALIVSAMLQSRWKEIIIMNVRGFSSRQLSVTLLLENIIMMIFALFLGSVVGFVYLRGQNEMLNMSVQSLIERRIIFSTEAQIVLASIIIVIFASTVIPILASMRQLSERLNLKVVEDEL